MNATINEEMVRNAIELGWKIMEQETAAKIIEYVDNYRHDEDDEEYDESDDDCWLVREAYKKQYDAHWYWASGGIKMPFYWPIYDRLHDSFKKAAKQLNLDIPDDYWGSDEYNDEWCTQESYDISDFESEMKGYSIEWLRDIAERKV